MKYKLGDICNGIADGSHNPPTGGNRSDFVMLSSKNVFDDQITYDDPRYLSEEQFLLEDKRTKIKTGDVLITIVGTVGRSAVVGEDEKNITLQRSVAVLHPNNEICNSRYLMYSLRSMRSLLENESHGIAQKGIYLKQLSSMEINLPMINEQESVVKCLDAIWNIIKQRKRVLQKYDELIKARFVEMFGDLKANTNGWKVRSFLEFAKIDTVMIHDFSNYKHYPHIGIDSIEKDTGIIKGYRTVEEDGIVSGKYLFTDKHIIYSKIRPNLNKVAMPDFTGVCSADAYPILANENICNREFLTYVMRSNLFLDYILKFSSRTNLPKVNKEQVEGFACPIPSISIQKQFSSLVHQIDKSKVVNIFCVA